MKKKRMNLSINILCSLLAVSMPATIHAETLRSESNLQAESDSSIPVKVSIPANPINVSLPTSVDLVFDGKDINAEVANNYWITNNSKIGNIQVSNVKAKIKEVGWTMNMSNSDSLYEQLPLDSKQLYMGFSKNSDPSTPLSEVGIDPCITISPVGLVNSQSFKLEAKTGGSSSTINTNLIDLEFTIGYEKEDLRDPGLYSSNTLVKSWDQLVADNDITVEEITPGDSTRYRITESNTALSGDLVLSDSVTSIGGDAFSDCTSLTSITIPNSVTTIENYAFDSCENLTSVTIPNSVISIGTFAFSYCTSLNSITIPDSVTSIGKKAFYGCSSLTSITIPDSVTEIKESTFEDCTSLKSIVIPNSVTSIDDEAFDGCSSLTSITIPDSVTTISYYTFSGCSSLTSVTIPDSVTEIGGSAFNGCSNLTSVTIPDSVTAIGNYAFAEIPHIIYNGTAIGSPWGALSMNGTLIENDGLLFHKETKSIVGYVGSNKNINIPNEIDEVPVTTISNHAFKDCTSLTSITIPDSVTTIGYYAFLNCASLTSITIPESITSIGTQTFSGCTSLTSVTIPDSVTSIGTFAFSKVPHITYHGTATGSPWGALSIN